MRGALVTAGTLVSVAVMLTPATVTLTYATAMLSSAARLSAQEPTQADLRMVFDRVALETEWRIETAEATFEGRLSQRTFTSVRLSGAPPIRFDHIERAWEKGRATGRGAKWGALTLGIISAVVVGYDCSTEGAELDCNVPLASAVGGAAGAVGGFLIGVSVGALFPQWHLRYP